MRNRVLATAPVAAVLAVMLAGCGDDPAPGKRAPTPPHSRLSEREVRAFIKVAPGLETLRRKVAVAMTRGTLPANAGRKIEAYLGQHHFTNKSWAQLVERITYVVDQMRWEGDRARRNAQELIPEINKQKQLREGATDDLLREQTAARIAQLEAQLEACAKPTHAADWKLARSFWRDLHRLVPPRTPKMPPRMPPPERPKKKTAKKKAVSGG